MRNLNDYPERDRAYLAAHDMATQILRRGEIKAFAVTNDHTRGRLIHVESGQGWDPDPIFQEFDQYGFAPAGH